MTSYEEFQRFEEGVFERQAEDRRILDEGYGVINTTRDAEGIVGRVLNGRNPFPGRDFTKEEVFAVYSDVKQALSNHAEEYDREFETGGFTFVNQYRDMEKAETFEEFAEIAEEGFEWFKPYEKFAPVKSKDGDIRGRVEYEGKTHYRGALIPGNVSAKIFFSQDLEEEEWEALAEELDEALSGPLRI